MMRMNEKPLLFPASSKKSLLERVVGYRLPRTGQKKIRVPVGNLTKLELSQLKQGYKLDRKILYSRILQNGLRKDRAESLYNYDRRIRALNEEYVKRERVKSKNRVLRANTPAQNG